MTPEQIRQAFFTQLSDNWSATLIAWPNFVFDPSSDVAFIVPWVTMGDTFLGELQPEGEGLRYGIAGVSIYLPLNSGTKTGHEYATTIEALIGMKDLNGMITHRASTKELGKDSLDEINFYRIDVSVEFNAFSNA